MYGHGPRWLYQDADLIDEAADHGLLVPEIDEASPGRSVQPGDHPSTATLPRMAQPPTPTTRPVAGHGTTAV
jgi:hypothetical protein